MRHKMKSLVEEAASRATEAEAKLRISHRALRHGMEMRAAMVSLVCLRGVFVEWCHMVEFSATAASAGKEVRNDCSFALAGTIRVTVMWRTWAVKLRDSAMHSIVFGLSQACRETKERRIATAKWCERAEVARRAFLHGLPVHLCSAASLRMKWQGQRARLLALVHAVHTAAAARLARQLLYAGMQVNTARQRIHKFALILRVAACRRSMRRLCSAECGPRHHDATVTARMASGACALSVFFRAAVLMQKSHAFARLHRAAQGKFVSTQVAAMRLARILMQVLRQQLMRAAHSWQRAISADALRQLAKRKRVHDAQLASWTDLRWLRKTFFFCGTAV